MSNDKNVITTSMIILLDVYFLVETSFHHILLARNLPERHARSLVG